MIDHQAQSIDDTLSLTNIEQKIDQQQVKEQAKYHWKFLFCFSCGSNTGFSANPQSFLSAFISFNLLLSTCGLLINMLFFVYDWRQKLNKHLSIEIFSFLLNVSILWYGFKARSTLDNRHPNMDLLRSAGVLCQLYCLLTLFYLLLGVSLLYFVFLSEEKEISWLEPFLGNGVAELKKFGGMVFGGVGCLAFLAFVMIGQIWMYSKGYRNACDRLSVELYGIKRIEVDSEESSLL